MGPMGRPASPYWHSLDLHRNPARMDLMIQINPVGLMLLILWPLLLVNIVLWWAISIGASLVWAALLVCSPKLLTE